MKQKRTPGPKAEIRIKDVPLGTKDLFKAHCARRGQSMRKVLLDFISEGAREEGKLNHGRLS